MVSWISNQALFHKVLSSENESECNTKINLRAEIKQILNLKKFSYY
jgi:hypothetical protein